MKLTQFLRDRKSGTFYFMKGKYLQAFTLLLSFFSGLSMYAIPANPSPVEFTQPDGSTISILISGDERGREAFTLDGNPLIFDPEGFLVYAGIGENGLPVPTSIKANNISLRRPIERNFIQNIDKNALLQALEKKSESRNLKRALGDAPKYIYYGTPFPSVGEPHALVVLIEYPDRKFSMDNPGEFYKEQLNGENFNLYGAKGSARDYFIKNSNGIFRPYFDVLGPVMMKNPMEYYGSNDSNGDDMHPDEMLLEACGELCKTHNLSIYDHDGDGYIDNVFMIYAGYGENDSYISQTIWPHSAELETDYNVTSPDFNGVKANRYGCTCELKKALDRPDGIGTFVHEFGHVLGLPDLYNTFFSGSYTPGYWSVMDRGSYCNSGVTPCNYSSFEKYSLNWIEPLYFEEEGMVTLNNLADSNQAYIIPTENEDEFFLLENRQKKGYDEFLPHHGMLVWHIDFDQSAWDRNVVNNIKSHQRVDLVEADATTGSNSTSGDPFPGLFRKTSLSATTTPSLLSWNSNPTKYEISEIFENGDQIYFNVKGDFSAVNEIADSSNDIFSESGYIHTRHGDAAVYTLQGNLIGKLTPDSPIECIPGTIYIVRTEERTVKLLAK